MVTVEYRIVWVCPNSSPDIVEDVYEEGIEDINEAKQLLAKANKIADQEDDGLNWIARMQRVTKEFI